MPVMILYIRLRVKLRLIVTRNSALPRPLNITLALSQQRLEDSQTLQDALQKWVEDLEVLIKRQGNDSAQHHSVEVMVNKETETLPSNQADFQPNVIMALTSVLKELESNDIQDAIVSTQESEKSEVINEKVTTKAKKHHAFDHNRQNSTQIYCPSTQLTLSPRMKCPARLQYKLLS
jgi:hypothetical protein